MIPMVDLNLQYRQLQEEIDNGIRDVLENCQFILGPNVTGFETEAAQVSWRAACCNCCIGHRCPSFGPRSSRNWPG